MSLKIQVNNEVRDATTEEIAEFEARKIANADALMAKVEAARVASVKAQIVTLDLKRIRPLAELGSDPGAADRLADLNDQIAALRSKLQ